MTVRFGNYRIGFYVVLMILSAVVLGLAAHFASIFLPHLHKDFTIFALIAPSVTILLLLISLQWAQPMTEAILLTILLILWLTMGAWSTDVIGFQQCDSIRGQSIPTKNGQTSAQAYCYEMKVIQAFSWALFVLCVLGLHTLFKLVTLAQQMGRPQIWGEPIRELPWYGEWPGFYNTSGTPMGSPMGTPGATPFGFGPGSAGYGPGSAGVIIQPGMNGAPPTVTRY